MDFTEVSNCDKQPPECNVNFDSYTAEHSYLHQQQQHRLLNSIFNQSWHDVNLILDSKEFLHEISTTRGTRKEVAKEEEVQSVMQPCPLYAACSISSVPVEIIESILRVYGNSCCLEMNEEDAKLPIHVACVTPNICPKVILTLFQTRPETSKFESCFEKLLVYDAVALLKLYRKQVALVDSSPCFLIIKHRASEREKTILT